VPIEVGLTPVDTGGRSMVLAVVIDISERKQAEEELRRSNAELEQFAYVASHDLQEPLRMVASYTELLQRRYEGQLDERADKYIRYAVDGAKRMQLLISDLLRFSRLTTQAEPRTETDVEELVARVVKTSLAAQIRDMDGVVETGELPTVHADTRQLEQVFQNLISNGLKFRAEGRSPRVRIDAARRDADWLFTVRDNGIGIEQGYAERVFEMFQRLHPVGRYAGSGIGLTLVKKIVERHGGTVWFESEPGRGTTFYFTLPLEAEAQ
jgi:light-regulated signal transduction histidine kinase (bacteriophytochrome)